MSGFKSVSMFLVLALAWTVSARDDLDALLHDLQETREPEAPVRRVAVVSTADDAGAEIAGGWSIPPDDGWTPAAIRQDDQVRTIGLNVFDRGVVKSAVKKEPFKPEYWSPQQERFAALVREVTGKTIYSPSCRPPQDENPFACGFLSWRENAKSVQIDWSSPTNRYRYFLHEDKGGECTATLRVSFSRKIRFASLQAEMERIVLDLERRFAECGFGSVAVSENAYLNYVEDVGGISVFLFADEDKLDDEAVYTLEMSFSTDFLQLDTSDMVSSVPLVNVRRDADFGNRKTVEDMLSWLAQCVPVVRKVTCHQETQKADTSDGSVNLPVFEERLDAADDAWMSLIRYPPETFGGRCLRDVPMYLDSDQDFLCSPREVTATERRYEAMKFMNNFIHPCEEGFGWKEPRRKIAADQARFIEHVREITGRTILPSEAEPPFVTLSEMRRLYRHPTREFVDTVVDWNAPTNAYRYFPFLSPAFKQSPYSSTMRAVFSSRCTRTSLQSELRAVVSDLERRFADCGFVSQKVGEIGYVNYRPDVGVIAARLDRFAVKEGVFVLTLLFSTRFANDWMGLGCWYDKEAEALLDEAWAHGLPADGSVCADCLRKYMHGRPGCTVGGRAANSFDESRFAFDMPTYEHRNDESPSVIGRLFGCTWQSMLVGTLERRQISCFAEPRMPEFVTWDCADEPVAEQGVRYVPICRYDTSSSSDSGNRYLSKAGRYISGASEETKCDRVETNVCWRCQAVDSFVERFLKPRGCSDVTNRPGSAVCEICRGDSSGKKPESPDIRLHSVARARPMGSKGFRILRELARKSPEQNVFHSPLCVDSGMAVLDLGARGRTKTEIGDALGFSGETPELLKAAYGSFESCRRARIYSASSLWVSKRFPLKDAFAPLVRNRLGTEIFDVDFASGATVPRINGYVSEKTCGLIDGILGPGDVDATTPSCLVSTLYFKSRWWTKFDKSNTHDEAFYLASGMTNTVRMMNMKHGFPYYEDERKKAISMPYDEPRFSLVAVLPRGNGRIEELLDDLSAGGYWDVVDGFSDPTRVIVRFPKLDLDVRADLLDVFAAVGIREALSPEKADFGLMQEVLGEGIYIDKAKQRIRFKLDEESTEAASVFFCSVIPMCIHVEPPAKEFFADRPFVVTIYDNETGLILFAGVVHRP